jgi:hypothetical protein
MEATKSAAELWLEQNTIHCPVYKARFNDKQCEAMRKLPAPQDPSPNLAPGHERRDRHPDCGDKCPVYLGLQWKGKTAWQLVVEATGHTSQYRLADALGTNQSKISQMFIKLGKGKLPSGEVWNDMLELSGLSAQVLLAAATDKPAAHSTQSDTTKPVQHMSDCSVHNGPALPVGPCDCGAVPRADLPPLSQHLADAAALYAVDTAPTLMGADPAEQLPTREELDAMRQEVRKMQDDLLPAIPAIPADFVPFVEAPRASLVAPQIRFDQHGDVTINTAAVLAYGLDKVERVRLLYSAQRGQFAMQPGYNGPGSRKLALAKKGFPTRSVNSRTAVRQFGLSVAQRAFPLALDPSGLLVATITNAPAQPGGEA